MNRYTTNNILVKGLHLFVIAILLVGAFSLTPGRAKQAAMPTKPSNLLQFTAAGHVLGFQAEGVYVAAGDHMLRVEFVSASGVAPVADQMPSGNGKAQPLGRVIYANLWPGISLSCEHDAEGIVQSSYLLKPGADVGQIRLCYNAPVKIEVGGSLRIEYETGQMRESAPVAWQDIKGKRIPVDVTFCVLDSSIRNSVVGFSLGQYNPACPLIIDPTLQWHTFIGSSTYDSGDAIAVDWSGNVYVAGASDATWGLPVNDYAGGRDAFAAKLNSSGILQWNTFLGSPGDDNGYAIAVDGSGNVYVAGRSEATWGTPVNAHAGYRDAFAAKLDSSGTILWNTFLGSSSSDLGRTIAVDGSGNVYVAGTSNATWGTPVNAHGGGYEAFAAKLDNSGTLQWHTFLGAVGDDWGRAIAVDGSGNVYVAGDSFATWGTPVNAHTGGYDAFAAKLDSSGILLWNTFMGSSGFNYGTAIAVDGSGNVYVAGRSEATWGSPVNAHAGDGDAFAAKLNSNGAILWNTFMGSSSRDYGLAIALDVNGNVYVAGFSDASSWGVPGYRDAFAAKLDSNGTILWNTFMRAVGDDSGRAIAVDGSGNVYVAGTSDATWGTPVNACAGKDAFTAKLDSNGTILWNTFMGSSSDDFGTAIALDGSGDVYVAGTSDALGFSGSSSPGGRDAFVAKLDSSGTLQWLTFMGSPDADYGYSIAVDGSGNVYVAGTSDATWGTPVNVHASGDDAFAAKLDSNGTILWHTFMGSSSSDSGDAITVDGSGNVYVAGTSDATWGTPVNVHASGDDAFAAKLDSSGSLQWHTFMGSPGDDYGYSIAVDGSGNVYTAGTSDATWGTPVDAHAGGTDAFAAKLDSSGILQLNTFMGSSGSDFGYSIAVDGSGNVHVSGTSDATWGTPLNAHPGGNDAFVAKLDNSGFLQWNTFMGSPDADFGNAIALGGSGNVYVAGFSDATWGSPLNDYAGGADAFAAKLDSSGTLHWNTFMGSSSDDYGNAIAVDVIGNVYVAGFSEATWGMPVHEYAGGFDAFAAKIVIDSDGDGYWTDTDCDDSNASINPGATEVCNDGIDNDCDGDVDSADSDCTSNGGNCFITTAAYGF